MKFSFRSKILILLAFMVLIAKLNCQNITLLDNVNIEFTNNGDQTEFVVTSRLGGNVNPTAAWLGIGLNNRTRMDGASVVVCLRTSTYSAVHHYYNNGYASDLLSSNNPTLGITQGRVRTSGGVMTCSFTRNNTISNARYYNLNSRNPYVMVAYGTLGSGNSPKPGYHARRAISSAVVRFPVARNQTVG